MSNSNATTVDVRNNSAPAPAKPPLRITGDIDAFIEDRAEMPISAIVALSPDDLGDLAVEAFVDVQDEPELLLIAARGMYLLVNAARSKPTDPDLVFGEFAAAWPQIEMWCPALGYTADEVFEYLTDAFQRRDANGEER